MVLEISQSFFLPVTESIVQTNMRHRSRVRLYRGFCCKRDLFVTFLVLAVHFFAANGGNDVILAQVPTGGALSIAPVTGGFVSLDSGESLKVGPFRFYPALGFSETYTDNVFRTNANKQDDFIHTISPKLQAQVYLGNFSRLMGDYRFTRQLYVNTSERNNVSVQQAYGRWNYDQPGGMAFDIQAGGAEGFDPRGTALDSQLVEQNEWNTRSFTGQTVFRGSWAALQVNGQATQWSFLNNNQGPLRDRWNYASEVTVFGPLTPKTYLLLSGGISKEDYETNIQLDSFSYRIGTGIRLAPTGKTSGEVEVGYEVLNFDRAPIATPSSGLSGGGDGQQNLRLSGNYRWLPTSRQVIELRAFRSIQQSAVQGSTVFVQTGVDLSGSHTFFSRTTVTGNFGFEHDSFSDTFSTGGITGERTDSIINTGVRIDYQTVKWLRFGFSYNYQKRDSTFDVFNFDANNITFSILGAFNLVAPL